MVLRGKKTVFDCKFPHCNLKNLEVSYFFYHWRRVTWTGAATSRRVCVAHFNLLPLFFDQLSYRRARASAPGTQSALCRYRMGTQAKDPSGGTARCSIARVGHPD